MQDGELIKKFKEMPWEIWLHRRFPPFVTYLMMKYATSEGFKTAGLDGQFPFSLYDTDDWYSTPEMFSTAADEAGRYLKQKDIFTLVRQCEELLERGRKEMPFLSKSIESPLVLFQKALQLIEPLNVYVWIAHASEHYYRPIIHEAAKNYVPAEELEKFVGDISFPSKKNAMALLEDDVRTGASLETLYEKYAWLKARGGFKPGYTLSEMEQIQKETLEKPAHERSQRSIPPALEKLAKEAQELVYLRTLRTDALYEMYYLANPVFERYAKEIGIEGSLGDYIPDELLRGVINKIPHQHAILKDNDQVIVLKESIISEMQVKETEVKGAVAYKGHARGVVRLVHTPSESDKVQLGDILVTPMTTAAYISAMHRAAAFVTDEGGITCHAAILSRELKKPCIIGTKLATRILKDGDMVEVDAEKGIVRKI